MERCYKHLAQLNKDLLANNYRVEVPIFKQFHKFIIGKDGANIKKVAHSFLDSNCSAGTNLFLLINFYRFVMKRARKLIYLLKVLNQT